MSFEGPITEESICRWLIQAVARYVRVSVAIVNPSTAFQEVGLGSMAAVTLSAEMSDALGIDIDPMVTWEYPTIAEAARAIAQGIASARPRRGSES